MRNYLQFLNNTLNIFEDNQKFDEKYWAEASKNYVEYKDIPLTKEESRESDKVLLARTLDSHIFEMDDTTKKLLLLTNPPNKNDMFRLPFLSTFIDVEIKRDELEKYSNIKNFRYRDGNIESIVGLLIYDQGISSKDGGGAHIGRGLFFTMLLKGSDDKGVTYRIDAFFDNTNVDVLKPYHAKAPHQKAVRDFAINFLNLINSPDVKIVHVTRDRQKNLKRIKKGKFPLPSQCRIKLDGKLKVYVNQMRKKKKIWHYNNSFWVRGHWRTFRDERYVNKMGKRTWIPPYIKGKGILIKKDYKMEVK